VKVETSVLLPEELLAEIDRGYPDRSAFFEQAVRWYLNRTAHERRRDNDVAIINAHADELNAEADDVLSYQSPRS
jgi:metal-responsive CopG/Arc/MetJ family transcriptional regulator